MGWSGQKIPQRAIWEAQSNWQKKQGQMTQERRELEGEFKGEKEEQADTLRFLHNEATFYTIQQCIEKAGTWRKMPGTVNSLFCMVFCSKGHSLSFPLAQYNTSKQLLFHRPLK